MSLLLALHALGSRFFHTLAFGRNGVSLGAGGANGSAPAASAGVPLRRLGTSVGHFLNLLLGPRVPRSGLI